MFRPRLAAGQATVRRLFAHHRTRRPMKYSPFKDPYIVSALVLLASAWMGAWIWGWGPLVFGFFLLLYFIVALGIRLDEISAQMRETGRRLDRFLALEERRYQSNGCGTDAADAAPGAKTDDLQARLAAIDAALERIQDKIDP